MAFYRHRLTYDEIAPHLQKFRLWLRNNCPVMKEYEAFGEEIFWVNKKETPFPKEFDSRFAIMLLNEFICWVPFSDDYTEGVLIMLPAADGPQITVSPTHIRIPKLSHLITLTPEDFFGMMRVLDTAKNTQTGNSLMLNVAAAGYDSLETSAIYPFFTKLRVNWRMNTDYADKKWTNRETIHFLAGLEPTRDNQFSAMQVLTTQQNNDLLYFPVETVIQLELDWQQITDEYCLPGQLK